MDIFHNEDGDSSRQENVCQDSKKLERHKKTRDLTESDVRNVLIASTWKKKKGN